MTDEVRTLLTRELDLQPEDVYDVAGPLDLTALWVVYNLDRPGAQGGAVRPGHARPGWRRGDGEPLDVFSAIRQGDILVQHPYESFSESVEEFITQASRDPHVLAIKQTLYRTSGDSAIVRALIRAAEQGKQVAALVELKARGDEAANIGWARALEEAGVHVVYGLVGLKTHSKTALVVRQEGDGIRRYCHIGTGNYNSSTARMYEDIGILTAVTGAGRRPDRPVQLPDRLQPAGRVPAAAGGADHAADPDAGVDRAGSRSRRAGAASSGSSTTWSTGASSTPCTAASQARGADRSDRAGHLLPAARGARPVGQHPGAQHRGSLARALPDLLLRGGPSGGAPASRERLRPAGGRWPRRVGDGVSRRWRRESGRDGDRRQSVPGRLGRHDGTQPGPPGRGHRSRRGAGPAGPAPGDPRARPGRRHPGLGTRCGRQPGTRCTTEVGIKPSTPCRTSPSTGPAAVGSPPVLARGPAGVSAGQPAPPIRRRRARRLWCGPQEGRCGAGTGDGDVEVILVHRPRYDDWSLPKGKVDPGETDEQAALREVQEEASVEARIGPELPTTTYLDRSGKQKRVRYWAMTVAGGDPAGANEVDEARLGAAPRSPDPADLPARRGGAGRPGRRGGGVGAAPAGARAAISTEGSDVRRQEADHVLEAEPQRHQAHADADHEGADPSPAPGPVDQEARSDPQQHHQAPVQQGRRPGAPVPAARGCWPSQRSPYRPDPTGREVPAQGWSQAAEAGC